MTTSWCLRVNSGPEMLGEILAPGTSSRSLIIGRANGADAVFANDGLMSSAHFSFTLTLTGAFVADLGSTNGTFLNEVRVISQQVYPGDLIRAGKTVFEVIVETPSSPAVQPAVTQSPINTYPDVDHVLKNRESPSWAAPPSPAAQKLTIPSLALTDPNGATQHLSPQQSLIVGRASLSQWVYEHDLRMSSQHFQVEFNFGHWLLQDLQSTNGTFLNNERIMQSELHDGDVIQAGSTNFFVRMVGNPAIVPSVKPLPWPETQVENKPAPTSDTYSAPTVSDFATPTIVGPPFRVSVVCKTEHGLEATLEEGTKLVIGRSTNCDIGFPDDSTMSSRHVQVTIASRMIYLEDLGSTNGTKVNGQLIRSVELNHGDEFHAGAQVFVVYVEGETRSEFSDAMHSAPTHFDSASLLASAADPVATDDLSTRFEPQLELPPSKTNPLIVQPDTASFDRDLVFEPFACDQV